MTENDTILRDEQIVALFFSREERALAECDRKFGRYLFAVALNILKDAPDSEECKNDTYLRAWNAIPPEKPAVLKSYLAAIIRRLALDRYRKAHREKRVLSEATLSFEELKDCIPARAEDEQELKVLLNDFVTSLSRRERYLFIGRYYFCHPLEQLAKNCGCSLSTVNKDLAAVRKRLATLLEKEGYTV